MLVIVQQVSLGVDEVYLLSHYYLLCWFLESKLFDRSVHVLLGGCLVDPFPRRIAELALAPLLSFLRMLIFTQNQYLFCLDCPAMQALLAAFMIVMQVSDYFIFQISFYLLYFGRNACIICLFFAYFLLNTRQFCVKIVLYFGLDIIDTVRYGFLIMVLLYPKSLIKLMQFDLKQIDFFVVLNSIQIKQSFLDLGQHFLLLVQLALVLSEVF